MLKKSVGGLAFLMFVFAFVSPSLVGPKPADADPDIIHHYKTRVTQVGRLGIVCSVFTVDETEEYTVTQPHAEINQDIDGTHWHPVTENDTPIPRERTEYVQARCR